MLDTKRTQNRLILLLILLSSTIGLDQLTKAWARANLSNIPTSYFGDTVRLQHSENSGAFLSMGADLDSGVRFYICTVAVAIFLGFMILFLLKKKELNQLTLVAWSLVIGGGVGNLIDRTYKASVTDFLNFGIATLRTGILNVADMVIVAGVILLFFANQEKDTPK